MQEATEVVQKTEAVVTVEPDKSEQKTEQRVVVAPVVDFQRPRVPREVVEREELIAAEPVVVEHVESAEIVEIHTPAEPVEVVPQPVSEQLVQPEPAEQAPTALEPVAPVQSEVVAAAPVQPTNIEPSPVESSEPELTVRVEVVEAPPAVAAPPEAEQPETINTYDQSSAAMFMPEPFVAQSEAVPIEEVPYEPSEEPAVAEPTPEVAHSVVLQDQSEPIAPVSQPELVMELGPPAVTDSIEHFEAFVTELHDLEAPPETLEVVHEKVEKITELTVMIREAKLLDAGEGVAEITEELVETFMELFEATGMKLDEDHVRQMVQLWITRDVLAGKDFETAKTELFEDKGMHEVLQQFMHGIAKLKELLESLHVRLGRLVLASAVQPSRAV